MDLVLSGEQLALESGSLSIQISIIIWSSIALVADFGWRSGQYGEYGNRYVSGVYHIPRNV